MLAFLWVAAVAGALATRPSRFLKQTVMSLLGLTDTRALLTGCMQRSTCTRRARVVIG